MTRAVAKFAGQESPPATSIRVSCSILGNWKFWLMLAAVALIAGAALNWSWLVAAGLAPLVVGFLPCVAMCALGLCMAKRGAEGGCHGNGRNPPARTGPPAPSLADPDRPDAAP